MALTKSQLHSLAANGVRPELLKIERYLADIKKEFPDLFIENAPLQFVKLETKSNGATANGKGWPTLRITPPLSKQQTLWTPERRAAQGERMRKRQAKMQRAKKRARQSKATAGPQMPVWFRAYEFLRTQIDSTAPLDTLQKALKVKESSSILTGFVYHKDLFRRVSPGVYQVTRELSAEEVQHVRKAPTA
jgi:hypothetical protein